ncbi:MAG: DNA polymerase III subunit delta [Lachnospiraceae bacterium]|jgi:DNA polymerase-3 subunit delta'|nr:DNA polymerase III subunit delta [Lachnospiraceae bacterium]
MATFSQIVGQEQLKSYLQNAVLTGKVSHAMILEGEKSSGKEFCAKIYAMALQCQNREPGSAEPCGQCHSCKQMLSNNQPDIMTLQHEKPGVIGVEDIRTQINEDVYVKPYSSAYKVYIINDAEKMTQQAQNALLKTLEEPQSYVVILLLTLNAGLLLPTIVSRCVVIHMKSVHDDLIERYLMEQLQIPDYKAKICAAFARGNVGRAKNLAISEEFDHVKSEVLSMLKHISDMEIPEMIQAIRKITEFKMEIDDYLDLCAIWYRDVLLFKATSDANRLIFKEQFSEIRNFASRSSYEKIETVLEALDKAKKRLGANVNFELTMELLFLTLKECG